MGSAKSKVCIYSTPFLNQFVLDSSKLHTALFQNSFHAFFYLKSISYTFVKVECWLSYMFVKHDFHHTLPIIFITIGIDFLVDRSCYCYIQASHHPVPFLFTKILKYFYLSVVFFFFGQIEKTLLGVWINFKQSILKLVLLTFEI